MTSGDGRRGQRQQPVESRWSGAANRLTAGREAGPKLATLALFAKDHAVVAVIAPAGAFPARQPAKVDSPAAEPNADVAPLAGVDDLDLKVEEANRCRDRKVGADRGGVAVVPRPERDIGGAEARC
jgi:hypothetical protein